MHGIRETELNFSDSLLSTDIVLFKRRGEKIPYQTLQDLQSYRVGVVLDTAPHEILEAELHEQLDTATSTSLNIRKLIGKRFDLMADDKLNTLYLINTYFPQWRDSIEIISPPLQINHIHILIPKKRKESQHLISLFNKGLQSMKEDGTYNRILDEYHFKKYLYVK